MAGRSTAYKLALQEAKAETAQFILTLRGGQKKKTAQLGYRRGRTGLLERLGMKRT
jgi:hypothetical protein